MMSDEWMHCLQLARLDKYGFPRRDLMREKSVKGEVGNINVDQHFHCALHP